MTRNEKIAVGVSFGIAAIIISPELRKIAIAVLRIMTESSTPKLPASETNLDEEWIDIDVSDLTIH